MPSVNFSEIADIETSSEDYASRFTGEIGAWFLKVQEKATLCMLSAFPKANILDVGGGHGQLTGALVHNGYQVTVLGSADACKIQIQKFINENSCSFKVGNILDLPYPDQAFEIVVSFRLLPHVTQWKRFLYELTRVAKKAVIVDYPAVRSINYIAPILFQFKKRLEGNTRPYTSFKESELLTVFKSFGFICDNRYPEFFLPMVLHRILKMPRLSPMVEKILRALGMTYMFGSPVILKMIREGK